MKKFRTLAAVAGAVTLGLGLAACGSSSNDNAGSSATSPAAAGASSSSSASAACPNGSLTFGVEPYDDASKLIPAYKTLVSELSQKLGCNVQLQIAQSYVAEILAMKQGHLDIAEFGPAGYVFADQQAHAIPVASFADKDGKPSVYTAGIWVKKDSSIKTLADLKGHTLALSSTGSTSGDWVPRYALMTAGLMSSPTDKSQVHWNYAGGHPQSLLALTHGTADAAEVNSQEEASAEAAHQFDPSQYREIWKSQPILNDPVTMSPNLSAAQQSAIKSAILGLSGADLTKGGDSSIATELDFTPPSGAAAMVPVTKQDYAPLFALAAKLKLTPNDL